MSPALAEKLKKVTLKTLPIYLLAILLIITAKPRLDFYLFGLLFVLLGEGLRVWATGHLKKNQEVTTSGPYAYVKNPLYLGTFLIMIGFCFMANQIFFMAVGIAVFVLYYAPYKKCRESERLAQRFGQAWADYEARVPDYVPRWVPYDRRDTARWNIQHFFNNSEHETLMVVLVATALMSLKAFI